MVVFRTRGRGKNRVVYPIKNQSIPFSLKVGKSVGFEKLKAIHSQRSELARRIDESKLATLTRDKEKWIEHPNQIDFPGIDTPQEWRSEYEVKELKQTHEELVEYKQKLNEAKNPEERKLFKETLGFIAKRHERLEWQRKHPFFYAGYDGEGKKAYEEALAKNVNYGFDLRNPQSSFIETYYLKSSDIKGLKIMLEPSIEKMNEDISQLQPDQTEEKKKYTLTRAYIQGNILHIPPVRSQEEQKKTTHTILHEIGHYVENKNHDLQSEWEGRSSLLKIKELKRNPNLSLTGEIETVERGPWKIVEDSMNYFGFNRYDLDLFPWELGNILGSRSNLEHEAFAQTFSSYRSGEFKRQIKLAREQRKNALDAVNEARIRLDSYVGDKRSQSYTYKRKTLQETKKNFVVTDAVLENRVILYEWLRKRLGD